MPAVPLPDLTATDTLARHLAPQIRRGDAIALQGPLGAGKTSFARALLRALGIKEDVPSPTFTLLQTYETPTFPIHHFDLYRLKSETELDEIGWDEALACGVALIEWPERALRRMPGDFLTLHFTFDEKNRRTVALEPCGTWVKRAENLK